MNKEMLDSYVKAMNECDLDLKNKKFIHFQSLYQSFDENSKNKFDDSIPYEDRYGRIREIKFWTEDPRSLKYLITSKVMRENEDKQCEVPPFLAPIAQLLISKGYDIDLIIHLPSGINFYHIIYNRLTKSFYKDYNQYLKISKMDFENEMPMAKVYFSKFIKDPKKRMSQGIISINNDDQGEKLVSTILSEINNDAIKYPALISNNFMAKTRKGVLKSNSDTQNVTNFISYRCHYTNEKDYLKELFDVIMDIPDYKPSEIQKENS